MRLAHARVYLIASIVVFSSIPAAGAVGSPLQSGASAASPIDEAPPTPRGVSSPTGAPEEGDCLEHPPIRISQDEGPFGFVLAQDPVTETPVYRPGSGVTSGTGTAEDPYVIEGWCILAAGSVDTDEADVDVADAGIRLQGTSAHVVVRANVIAPPSLAVTGGPATATMEPASWGVVVDGAENVTVEANLVHGNDDGGVLVEESTDVTVRGNEIHNHTWAGVHLDRAEDVRVEANTLYDNGDGTYFRGPAGGIVLYTTEGATLVANTVRDNHASGIRLQFDSQATTIVDNTVRENARQGIRVDDSPQTRVEGNDVHANGIDGIRAEAGSDDTQILDNTVTESGSQGIRVISADRTTVAGNLVQHTAADAVHVFGSTAVDVVDNRLEDSGSAGVQLWNAEDAHVAGNAMTDGGLLLLGIDPAHYRHDVPGTNTLDGRPIVYVQDATDRVVDEDAGQVLVTHSTGVTVTGQAIEDAVVGIQVAESEDVTVRESELSRNAWNGLRVDEAAEVALEDVRVEENGRDGIHMRHVDAPTLVGVDASENGRYGVHLYDAPRAEVHQGTIEANANEGLRLWGTPDGVAANTTVRGNGHAGVRVAYDSHDLTVENNTISGNAAEGVLAASSTGVEITDNAIEDNQDSGVHLGQTDATLRGNTLTGNAMGVTHWASDPVDARENWWGCPDGPSDPACDGAEEGVLVDPWLTEPNPDAGAG